MWCEKIFDEVEKFADKEQSIKMTQYMQNKFKFLGIQKPKLNLIIKPYLKESKKYDMNWNFIYTCWEKDYREAQYIAITYLMQNKKLINEKNFEDIKKLVITKSWWETVDSLDSIIGEIVLKNKELEKVMLEWSKSDNLWLRRVSIDFQQRYKEQTNSTLLEKIISNNLGSEEFFINKAIGWSLREYSKTNRIWVKNFVLKNKEKMNKLSIKEASKYL